MRAPYIQNAEAVDESDEQQLGGDRVPQTQRRLDDRIEARLFATRNELVLSEAFHHVPQTRVDDELGHDHQRQRDKKSDVQVDIVEKRQNDAADRPMLVERQQEQRQPA